MNSISTTNPIRLIPSGSGVRAGGIDVNFIPQPGIERVTTAPKQTMYPQFHVLNTELFKGFGVPHIPSDVTGAFTYGSNKKICKRQHAAYWVSATYTTDSLGDGTNPGTPYKFFLASMALPQLHQQTRLIMAWQQSSQQIDLFNGIPKSIYNPLADGSENQYTDWYANTITNRTIGYITSSETGIGKIGETDIGGSTSYLESLSVPNRTPDGISSITSCWAVLLKSDGTIDEIPPNGWNGVLNDTIIAGCLSAYGYGNTSNAGLSSYSWHASPAAGPRRSSDIKNICRSDSYTFSNMSGSAASNSYRDYSEPTTGATTTLLPAMLTVSGSIISNDNIFQLSNRSWTYNPGPAGTSTYIHRFENMRAYLIATTNGENSEPLNEFPT